MSDFIERDELLGISKRIIKREPEKQTDQTMEHITSALSKMKEKSVELSQKTMEASFNLELTSGENCCSDISKEDLTAIESDEKASQGLESIINLSEAKALKFESDAEIQDFSSADEDDSLEDIEEFTQSDMTSKALLDSQLIEQFKSEIEFLKKQIDVKDAQLGSKDELILNFQVLLKSEQDKILLLETKLESEESVDNRSWITRVFGKRIK